MSHPRRHRPCRPRIPCLLPSSCRVGCCCRVSRALSRWIYSVCPFRVEGAGLEVPHLFHDSSSCRGSDACLLGSPLALPAGTGGHSPVSFRAPWTVLPPQDRSGAAPGAVPMYEPELPRIPLPVLPQKCPGGRKGQILYVRYGKRLLAGEVQPRTTLPSLGTAERERSSAAWLEWALGAPILFAFDCYGLLFSGKVAAAPVGLLS